MVIEYIIKIFFSIIIIISIVVVFIIQFVVCLGYLYKLRRNKKLYLKDPYIAKYLVYETVWETIVYATLSVMIVLYWQLYFLNT